MSKEKENVPTIDKAESETGAKATPPSPSVKQKEKAPTVAVWQFKYKKYQMVMPFISGKEDDGRRAMVKARNWRLNLDLTDPEQKKTHEYLLKKEPQSVEFWQLTEREEKHGEDRTSQGEMLRKLLDMSLPQLLSMMPDAEFRSAGVTPGTATDKATLITAIMDHKRIN